jgi:hypothetical protein
MRQNTDDQEDAFVAVLYASECQECRVCEIFDTVWEYLILLMRRENPSDS